MRREGPEKVVGPWRSAEQEQEPRGLQAGQDSLKIMGAKFLSLGILDMMSE